jgi:hypothetical protein
MLLTPYYLITKETVTRLPVKIFVFGLYALGSDELGKEDEAREGLFASAVQFLHREGVT